MRRRVLMVIVSIALLCCVFGALVACESYKATPISPVGDKNAPVESNGGLVVKQGDYLYFVNGYSGYLTTNGEDNFFGHVTKGAIVRVSYHEGGTLGNDPVVVVPKSVMADSADVGFSIYGEYIYYVSPSPEEDRNSGTVNTGTLQFLRTKIDGTGTQRILSIDNTSVRYKYTPTALFIYDETDSQNKVLYTKDLTKKGFKKTVISDKVTSVQFPKSENYDPETGVTIADYVFYTKDTEDTYDADNILYVASPDGKVNKEVIGESSYGDKGYNISMITSAVTDDGKIALYYTKTSYSAMASSSETEGTFAYLFDSSFTFDKAGEKKMTTESLSDVYAVGFEGVYVYGSEKATIFYKTDRTQATYGDLKMNKIIAIDDTYFYYLNGDNKLLRFAISGEENACYAYSEDKKFMTSFTGVECFKGCVYGIVDDDYDYVYRLDLATISATDPSAVKFERIGKLTAADAEKLEKAEEESED